MKAANPFVRRGFTLLELLSTVAILGVLAALLLPGMTAARRSADRARTKTQFAQWTAAVESFRREYGYYPAFHASGLINAGATETDHLFHDVLAAQKRSGAALADSDPAAMQNRKRIGFHTFAPADFTAAGLIGDARGNTDVAVLLDRDLDGMIKTGADFTSLPVVGGITPGADIIPATGIRAGVVFYAPAPDASASRPEFILSWK